MGMFTWSELGFVLGIVIFAAMARAVRQAPLTVVLQKFAVDDRPRLDGTPAVELVGRAQGLIAFVLTAMGFSATTTLTVSSHEVHCQSASLSGRMFQFIPLRRVSSVSGGIRKPIASLVVAAFVLLGSIMMTFSAGSLVPAAVGVLFAGLLVVAYFLSKKFILEFRPYDGAPIAVMFKPSVIEGVPVDVEKALRVIDVLRGLVLSESREDSYAGAIDGGGADGYAASPAVAPEATMRIPTPASPPPPPPQQQSPTWEFADEEPSDPETEAREAFARAKQLFQEGDKQAGLEELRHIVDSFPGTVAASHAERHLERAFRQGR